MTFIFNEAAYNYAEVSDRARGSTDKVFLACLPTFTILISDRTRFYLPRNSSVEPLNKEANCTARTIVSGRTTRRVMKMG